MVKVIRVITRLNIGGPAIHTILLSSELNLSGAYKDILICGEVGEGEGDMSYLAKEKGVEPVRIPHLKREISLKDDLKAFWSIYLIIRKERPDIVHTHTAKAGTLGRFAAMLAGVPVRIHTFHGHVFDGYFDPVRAKIFIAIERLLTVFTDKVVTVSRQVEDDIVRKLGIAGSSKSSVIPLGLELDKFLRSEETRGRFRKSLGIGDDVLLVGIVGRLTPIKNHRMFLRSIKKVSEISPGIKAKYLVIGDGELKGELMALSKSLGIEGSVVFTGWAEDLASVYSDLDIVALTSLNEGTPVSIIEGMASARPVISTDVGGVSDIVSDGQSGILVKSDDHDDFAIRLIELMSDAKLRSALGANGRKLVESRYSKTRLVSDVKKLYAECMVKR